jgi:predicted DNA-binding protein
VISFAGLSEVRKQMHQTTIRFDTELWRRIDVEAARIGISAAQYIRDATLIRLTDDSRRLELAARAETGERLRSDAAAAMSGADLANSESRAVWAQAQQARDRARSLRARSHQLSELRALRPWGGGGLDSARSPEAQ